MQLQHFARSEFDKNRSVPAKNFMLVEHLLRKGHKLRALLQSSSVTGLQGLSVS